MLPLSLLTQAQDQAIMIELKSGETLNGHLVNVDSRMNLTLKDVIQTSANGEVFLKLQEAYVRGNHIKYLKIPDEVIDKAKEQQTQHMERWQQNRGGHGRGGSRGGRRYERGDRQGGQRRGGNRNYNHNHRQQQQQQPVNS